MDSSRTPDEDQMADAKQHFFFTRNVAKSKHFIVDWTDAT